MQRPIYKFAAWTSEFPMKSSAKDMDIQIKFPWMLDSWSKIIFITDQLHALKMDKVTTKVNAIDITEYKKIFKHVGSNQVYISGSDANKNF